MTDFLHTVTFFSRCTMEARRAMWHATNAVHALGGPTIQAEHLLLGLMESDVRASRYLGDSDLRRSIVRLLAGATLPESSDVPMGDTARQVLRGALAEADRGGHPKIQSGHLLLGLLAVPGSVVPELLRSHGISSDQVRADLGSDSLERES
jgi:ATP-dependent Clp protease ATP-binding subunit ClpA